MINVKHILVPVDFSEYSRNALRYGLELADRLDARVTALHANWLPTAYIGLDVLVPEMASGGASLQEYTQTQAEQQLLALLRDAAEERVELIGREVVLGDPARVIVERAEQGDVDLIVMGTHGRSGLDHWLIGSIAEKVVRQAPCPVLTVRYRADDATRQKT